MSYNRQLWISYKGKHIRTGQQTDGQTDRPTGSQNEITFHERFNIQMCRREKKNIYI